MSSPFSEPHIGQVDRNMRVRGLYGCQRNVVDLFRNADGVCLLNDQYVDGMIEAYSMDSKIDILMLSEVDYVQRSWRVKAVKNELIYGRCIDQMAFTGYVFKTKDEVAALAEPQGSGKTFDWCRRHALRLKCMVTCGYVEKDDAGSPIIKRFPHAMRGDPRLTCSY